MAEEQKFPSEMIDLPSGGRLYPKDSPLREGKLEIKYMTAREEDILTSQNLIKKGVVINKLLDSLILTPGVKCDDLILGDKNAVMVAARILAYGSEYDCEIVNPNTGNKIKHIFDLSKCPFKKTPDDIEENSFEFKLPICKKTIIFKVLTGREEELIDNDIKGSKKIGVQVSPELTTRLRYMIQSVEGNDDKSIISNFSENILARDSMELRKEVVRVSPDIDLTQEVELEGETVEVAIPMTVNFFWPSTSA
tara:strand:- start:722 stop:1474 length:753 start_codon:yes stop_codon:yes gene_type:complete